MQHRHALSHQRSEKGEGITGFNNIRLWRRPACVPDQVFPTVPNLCWVRQREYKNAIKRLPQPVPATLFFGALKENELTFFVMLKNLDVIDNPVKLPFPPISSPALLFRYFHQTGIFVASDLFHKLISQLRHPLDRQILFIFTAIT
jgi:hypothetical protein